METKDTLSSCSNSKAQQMQQIQDKAKKSCMVSFQQLHSHLKRLSQNDLQGSRTESGFKRAFATIYCQDTETFTGTMFLNVEQLEKQLDKEDFQEIGPMAAFNVLETQFQMFITNWDYLNDEYVAMTRSYFIQYTGHAILEFRDTLIQHLESVKKSIDEKDTSNRSGNDAHDDVADIRPIYDEEPMAEVQTTAKIDVFAIGQQHTEQPEFNNEGKVVQNAEECHDKCPLPAILTDNQFAKSSILGKPMSQPLRNQSVVRQLNAFKSERPRISKPSCDSQVDVHNDLSKPVTTHYLPKEREAAPMKPHHIIASSNSRISSKNMPTNSKPSLMPSARTKSTANGSKPMPRRNTQTSRNWPASKNSFVMTKTMPIAEHSRNSRNFSDSKHFVCSTCQKCVFSANHDSCVIKFLKEVNSRSKVPSNKTTNRNKPVVQKKTMTHRSCLRWKLTGKIFKTVGLRWVPTGRISISSTTKVDSEPLNGSNADITNQYECEQTLDVSAGTSYLSAGTSFNMKEEGLRVCLKLELHDHSNEQSSSKLVPDVVPPADKTATSRQVLELLFHHHITMLRSTYGNPSRANFKQALGRSYALSWKPCQGDSLNLPDHRKYAALQGSAPHFKETLGTHNKEAGLSRSKRPRQHETMEEVLLPQVHYKFLLWEGCSRDANLDTTTFRDLIDSDGKLILEDPQLGVPRVGIPTPPRASIHDLYDKIGRMEIRQEAIGHMEYRHSSH
uniref:Integrase, catalytic region, zinc finger, CCHC-type, peptidase aspartic, catalytic n=1 Tax=Tanacetum cinerariifolium TaxID=118510 RepID=A0A6L2JY38_TANCI|nr:hypothetical protein [Tanacetum cinerariifolium]